MTKRLFRLVALIGVVVLMAGAATATGADTEDSVVGGVLDAFNASVGFAAQSGPSGETPFGHISATVPWPGSLADTVQVRLRVTCVAVEGNLAAVGGVVTASSASDVPAGFPFVVVFRDAALPGGEGDAAAPLPAQPAASCAEFVSLAATAPAIRSGNVLIRDASPAL